MIIRILGEGQYDVPAAAMNRLNVLDAELETEIEAAFLQVAHRYANL